MYYYSESKRLDNIKIVKNYTRIIKHTKIVCLVHQLLFMKHWKTNLNIGIRIR